MGQKILKNRLSVVTEFGFIFPPTLNLDSYLPNTTPRPASGIEMHYGKCLLLNYNLNISQDINKSSAYRENRLEQVSTGNTLAAVFLIDLFIPVSGARANLLENSLASNNITFSFNNSPSSGH